MWHVRAEALRQVRTVDMPAEHAAALVDLLIDEVLDRRSIALAAPHHGIEEPEVLRRVDGSSVYTAAGAELYTLQRILDAEQRLVTHRRTTRRVSRRSQAIDLALLEMANGPQPMLGRLRSHHTVRMPADYVCTSTGLGYATTIHAAQGVTAETMHGLLTGDESRQQLYTMLTRGRAANHLYLEVVSDGDPHTLIRPDTVAPGPRPSCSDR